MLFAPALAREGSSAAAARRETDLKSLFIRPQFVRCIYYGLLLESPQRPKDPLIYGPKGRFSFCIIAVMARIRGPVQRRGRRFFKEVLMSGSSRLNSFGARSVLPLSEGGVEYYKLSALSGPEVPLLPVRVLMQDFTGGPALTDMAALRDALARLGRDPQLINPRLPVDLIIDHSVQVDAYGSREALEVNARKEFERNRERYEFLHWGQKAFTNFKVVPPASGICHQVNLEYLGKVVWRLKDNGAEIACPDTLVGTDSHTTMINGLGILGWGVGGIEAAAAMLGQPVFIKLPEVIGVRFTGAMPAGSTATDLVLAVT